MTSTADTSLPTAELTDLPDAAVLGRGVLAGPEQSQLMAQLLAGFMQSQALFTFARLDLARALLDRPQSIADLAAAAGAEWRPLDRLLRYLASLGVVTLGSDERFAITSLGASLASGVPGSVRDLALFWMMTTYEPFMELHGSVQTGTPAVELRFGKTQGELLDERPDWSDSLTRAMTAVTAGVKFELLAAYRLPPGRIVVDLGGADGTLLASMLKDEPERRGIVFDVAQPVSAAAERLAAQGLVDRIEARVGDFFRAVPEADVYVLSSVLHDWNDEGCATILRNVARVARPGASVVVIDCVLPDGGEPHPGRISDMLMLGVTTGWERTISEFTHLLGAAGFGLHRRISGSAYNPFSVLEFRSSE